MIGQKNFYFNSSQHIRRKKDFNLLFEKGFRIYGSFFVFRIMFEEEISESRLGMIVAKKFGNAVYRNRMRRIIREHFRVKHYPIPMSILVHQTKPFPNEILAKKELRRMFSLLKDTLFVRQLSVGENIALKQSQFSTKNLSLFGKLSFYLVYAYRKFFSKSLPMACRFTPSCSVYSMEALRVYGFWRGWYLTFKRLLACRPAGGSGFDPVPFRKYRKNKPS